MPTFTVTAWRPAVYYASIEIEAATAMEAIERAREPIDQADYELCDMGKPDNEIDEMRAETDTGEQSATWMADHLKLHRAAEDMLAALQTTIALLHDGGDEQCLPGDVAQAIRAAIAKATT